MNDILLEQGLLEDGESPNNRLLSNPMGGINPSGGFGNGIVIEFTCEAWTNVSFRMVPEISSVCPEREYRQVCGKSHLRSSRAIRFFGDRVGGNDGSCSYVCIGNTGCFSDESDTGCKGHYRQGNIRAFFLASNAFFWVVPYGSPVTSWWVTVRTP